MFRRNVHDISRYNCRISTNISEYSKLVQYIPRMPDLFKGKFLIIYTVHQNINHQHPPLP